MFPKLEKCCCGSLQFGTQFMAWLQMIYCLIMLVIGSGHLYFLLHKSFYYNEGQLNMSECMDIASNVLLGKMLYIFLVSVLGINFIFVIALLFGINKKKHQLFIPHIFSSGLRIIGLCLLTFFLFLYSFINVVILTLVPVLISVNCFEIYSWLLIYSTYDQLKRNSTTRSNPSSPVRVV